jgi:hypothetical protein
MPRRWQVSCRLCFQDQKAIAPPWGQRGHSTFPPAYSVGILETFCLLNPASHASRKSTAIPPKTRPLPCLTFNDSIRPDGLGAHVEQDFIHGDQSTNAQRGSARCHQCRQSQPQAPGRKSQVFFTQNHLRHEAPQHLPAARVASEKNRVCHYMSPWILTAARAQIANNSIAPLPVLKRKSTAKPPGFAIKSRRPTMPRGGFAL